MKTITRTFYIDHNGYEHTTPESCAASLCEDSMLTLGRDLTKFELAVLSLYKQDPKAFWNIINLADSMVSPVD